MKIEVTQLQSAAKKPLLRFLKRLEEFGEAKSFRPHEFTEEAVAVVCDSPGNDYYCALWRNSQIFAYGMLRGWNDGFEVPALGVAVDPEWHGKGLGRMMIHFLHAVARMRGCCMVILHVDSSNVRARQLYESIGYTFSEHGVSILRGRFLIRNTKIVE
ncbi:MAG: GNAT family N-acetyltransferase [Prosthecobacter sp.]